MAYGCSTREGAMGGRTGGVWILWVGSAETDRVTDVDVCGNSTGNDARAECLEVVVGDETGATE